MNFGISIGDILKICELANKVYKNCRDCPGEYSSLATEARSLTNLLDDIQDKFDKIPESKYKQLYDAYEPCFDVLQELDKLLNHYNSLDTKSKRAWDRLKWDPDKSRTLRGRLTSSVSMLNAFYTSLIHDSQVLILEALGRLELDYRGGHREESISSIGRITSSGTTEDEEDEAAWAQILRDLEDVGVARQAILSNRSMIIDWFVTAVNEGRLLEQVDEPVSLATMPQDFSATLPELAVAQPGSHYLDVPDIFPTHRSQSVPNPSLSPVLTPSLSSSHPENSIPSPASLPAQRPSVTSSYTASNSSNTDTSSSYAWPQPVPPKTAAVTADHHKIKRVPVPSQVLPIPVDDIQTSKPVPTEIRRVASTPSLPIPAAVPPLIPPPVPPVFFDESISAPQVYNAENDTPHPPLPPSYFDKKDTITADLAWTSQQIVAAWTRRDFSAAEKHLQEQLSAVELGHTVLSTGLQPDRRILRFLLGVCASYTGSFIKAKERFESVFNSTYLHRNNLDDGEIAAARWLGDACLHLREHQNAVLAWSVAFEGCLSRYGIARDRTQRVIEELRLLDNLLFGFRRIENSFHNNIDPTDIFKATSAVEKSSIIATVKAQVVNYTAIGSQALYGPRSAISAQNPRPKTDAMALEGFLLGPLISMNAWPIPWDSTFSPKNTMLLDRCMNTVRIAQIVIPLVDRDIPTTSLGASKNLHYLTRRGSRWLIETVKRGLQDIGIEHAEHWCEPSIVCCLNQTREGYTFSEGIEICFRKLQFRNVYGVKVTDVKWTTRSIDPTNQDPTDFKEILKSFLTEADNAAGGL